MLEWAIKEIVKEERAEEEARKILEKGVYPKVKG